MAKKETAFGAEKNYRDYAQVGKELGRSRDIDAIREHVQTVLGDNIPESQRSAAILQHCSDVDVSLFEPFFPELFQILESPIHPSGPRITFRILEKISIPEEHLGRAVDLSFQYLTDHNSAVAEKAFAMGVIAGQLDRFPELKNEFALICEGLYPTGSAGVKSRIRNINKRKGLGLEL